MSIPKSLMTNYFYAHVVPDHLDDGRPLSFGTEVDLSAEQQKANARLLDSNALVAVASSGAKSTKKTKNETEEVSS